MDSDKKIKNLEAGPQVIYEDNHLLVVFKPHRLLVQSDASSDPTLFLHLCSWLKEKYKKPGNVYLGMIHRLDRPAAGLLVFAKTSKGASRLSEQMRSQRIKKKYQAVVEGVVAEDFGRCVGYLSDPEQGRAQVFDSERPDSKRAELTYRVLERKKSATWLEIQLVTGRRHQIRTQMAHLGHPLIGDIRYGGKQVFFEGAIALVASQLSIEHPVSQQTMDFEVPAELNSVLRYWRGV